MVALEEKVKTNFLNEDGIEHRVSFVLSVGATRAILFLPHTIANALLLKFERTSVIRARSSSGFRILPTLSLIFTSGFSLLRIQIAKCFERFLSRTCHATKRGDVSLVNVPAALTRLACEVMLKSSRLCSFARDTFHASLLQKAPRKIARVRPLGNGFSMINLDAHAL
jgi:putative copper export protein